MAKGPGDSGAKEIRILARGTEKGPMASPHQRQPSSKITSDSESSVRSCRLPCSPTRFLGPGTNVIVFASYKRNGDPKAGPPFSSRLCCPTTGHRPLRQHRINDRSGPRQHTTGTRSRLIASHESKEKSDRLVSYSDRLSLGALLIYWLIWKCSIYPAEGP